jgi:hypothetical protein
MSYQVLQDWAALNIGSVILPKSKVTDNERAAFSINGKGGKKVTIAFEPSAQGKGSSTSPGGFRSASSEGCSRGDRLIVC